MSKAILTLTDRAVEQVQKLLDNRGKPSLGIRIGIRTKGCNGMSYSLEYADTQNPLDEVLDQRNIKVLIDPKAIMFLIGSEMDYEETELESGFIFKNPNEKGKCGCGESFHV